MASVNRFFCIDIGKSGISLVRQVDEVGVAETSVVDSFVEDRDEQADESISPSP